MNRERGIRRKIIALSLVIMMILLAAFSLLLINISNRTYRERYISDSFSQLSEYMMRLDTIKDNIEKLLIRVSINENLKSSLRSGDSLSWFDSYEEISSFIEANPSYFYINRIVVSDSSFTHFIQVGNDISNSKPLNMERVLREIEASSDLFCNASYSELSFSGDLESRMSMEIIDYNTGLTLGYVTAAISVTKVLDAMSDTSQPYISYAIYTDGAAYTVGENGVIRYGENDFLMDPDSWLLYSISDKEKVYKYNGLLIEQLISDDGYSLLLLLSEPDLFDGFTSISYIIPMMVFSALLIIALMVAYLDRIMYRPVVRLAQKIRKIRIGDYTRDESIETSDELGLVGKGINDLSEEVTTLIERRVEDERAKIELEYKMLQSQINPHFLYNTLNAIKWMATLQHADGIAEMVLSLSRLMKVTSKGQGGMISLEEELSFIDDYMTIMRYRYGSTITYIKRIEKSALDVRIPRFTLQPLVENAIFHGLEPKGEGCVAIVAKCFPSHVSVLVADNGVGFDTKAKGERKSDAMFRHIGIENITKRLKYEYNGRDVLSIWSKKGVGTSCILHLVRSDDDKPCDNCR